jgi:hypothetical protein
MQLQSINLTAWGSLAKDARSGRKRRQRFGRCCTDVTIMLNGLSRRRKRRRFSMYYDHATYRVAFEHLRELGVRPHVCSWVRPDLDWWIEPMVQQLLELREVAPFESVLLDAEGAWSRGFPERPRRRADREVEWGHAASLVAGLLNTHNIEWGATDVPMVDWDVFGPLAVRASYVMPQCHEFGLRGGIRKPGRLVAWTHRKWPKRLPKWVDMRPHLAVYGKTQTPKGLREDADAQGAARQHRGVSVFRLPPHWWVDDAHFRGRGPSPRPGRVHGGDS